MFALWKTVTLRRWRRRGVAEGVPRDARAGGLAGHLQARHHAGHHLVLDAAVKAFGVLADDHHVHVLEPRLDAGHAAHRPHGGVQVQRLAQLHVDRAEPLADRRGDRPLEGDLVRLDGGERALRQDVVIPLFEGGGAGRQFDPFDRQPRRLEDALGGGGDFGPDAVAGDENDRVLGHSGGVSFLRPARIGPRRFSAPEAAVRAHYTRGGRARHGYGTADR